MKNKSKTAYNKSFINYDEQIRYRKNIKKMKLIITLFVIIITIILIIITRNIQENIETSEQSADLAIKHTELEEGKLKQQAKEQEREQEEIKKQEKLKKQKEEREAKMPKLTEVGKQNMANIYHSETKRVFLTFDDGPSTVTPQILEELKKENIKATFFVLGTSVENFPETTKKIWDEGHFIANHGYSHVYSSIYSSSQSVLDEFNKCNSAVQKAIGEPEYNSHLFRFPGGLPGGKYDGIKHEAKNLLEENGILNIDWNALTGDAETQHPTAEKLMERLQETVGDKTSVVVLMHDAQSKQVTADMLPQIIAYFKEQGYEFKSFYDIIK